jgi:CRP/FNR family transcriptional regulator, cyclic AMP receptor protein
VTALIDAVRTVLLPLPEVSRLISLRRSTSLFAQGQTADALYFLEEGLVKLTRTNESADRVILAILGPGELLGDEALARGAANYQVEAEILTTASLWRIPRDVLHRCAAENSNLSASLLDHLVHHKITLARKVELLCLHDVEYRILYYLAELSSLVKSSDIDGGHQLPLTQAELADLIGATRETTSTTLNQLERRGLLKLSRRLLTIPSVSTLRDAVGPKKQGEPPIISPAIPSLTLTANVGI